MHAIIGKAYFQPDSVRSVAPSQIFRLPVSVRAFECAVHRIWKCSSSVYLGVGACSLHKMHHGCIHGGELLKLRREQYTKSLHYRAPQWIHNDNLCKTHTGTLAKCRCNIFLGMMECTLAYMHHKSQLVSSQWMEL